MNYLDLETIRQSFNNDYFYMHKHFGSQIHREGNKTITTFLVYAPNAKNVIIYDIKNNNPFIEMKFIENGLFYTEIEEDLSGFVYKYQIISIDGEEFFKCDPFARTSELRPNNASIVFEDIKYDFSKDFKLNRQEIEDMFLSVYELHLGSFIRSSENDFLNYKDLAKEISLHCIKNGYNYIELLPITEHPLDESWGYQSVGYFSITSRFGTPHEFKIFIEEMHNNNIGVIIDFVPGHMCKDEHGLYNFDGSDVFSYPKESEFGENPDWGTPTFDLTKPFVRNYLISSMNMFFEEMNVDGFRIDAVSALFHYFGKRWLGDNVEGQKFLRDINTYFRGKDNKFLMLAEDSSSEPLVTGKVEDNGFYFTHKWNMGFMNNTLRFINKKPEEKIQRSELFTHPFEYASSENYILPFSHDEVVHMKGSLFNKYYHGTLDEKIAHYKILLGHYFMHPGKKLFFMGQDHAQSTEWDATKSLPYNEFNQELNQLLNQYFIKLQNIYENAKCLHVDSNKTNTILYTNNSNIYIYKRLCEDGNHNLVIINFDNADYTNYNLDYIEIDGTYKLKLDSNNYLLNNNKNNNVNIEEFSVEKPVILLKKLSFYIFEKI